MQSIKTILLFEAMYRYHVLGMSFSEIENQLKNYPTHDAQDLLKKVRDDIAIDTLNRDEESEDDITVTEAQASGGKEEYRAHFNKMLQQYGATSISELPKEKRKEFFLKIDKHWKSDKESKKKVKEEIEWTDDVYEEFTQEFSEFTDILHSVKAEMEKEVLEEKSATKRTTQTRITRATKIDRAIGSLSVQYAKRANDPLYKKFKKFKDKWMKFKERIQAKYKARVRTAARQGGGIGHLFRDEKKEKKKEKTKPKKK